LISLTGRTRKSTTSMIIEFIEKTIYFFNHLRNKRQRGR